MFGLGISEVLIILVIALIFIGPKKLPELAKSIGKGFREFQRAKDGLMTDIKKDVQENSQDTSSIDAHYSKKDHASDGGPPEDKKPEAPKNS